MRCAFVPCSQLGALPLNFAHDPDFYKLLRAVRWYSAASCPSGNNPASSSYWSPPGAMAAAAAAVATATPAATAAAATEGEVGALPAGYFGSPATTAAASADDDLVLYQGPPPTRDLCPEGVAAVAAARSSSTSKGGIFGRGGSKASKPFPASSWLKSLHLPGKGGQKGKAAPLTATMTLAQGGFSPLAAAAPGAGQLPTSSSAVEYAPGTGAAAAAGHHSRSNSSSSSLAAAGSSGKSNHIAGHSGSAHHSPSAPEGSSVVARTAAAEIARAAVAAVVERAALEEQQASAAAQRQCEIVGAPDFTEQLMNPTRSHTSSPKTCSYTSSVPVRPQSAVTTSAPSGVTTQATLRRLLGFSEDGTDLGNLGQVCGCVQDSTGRAQGRVWVFVRFADTVACRKPQQHCGPLCPAINGVTHARPDSTPTSRPAAQVAHRHTTPATVCLHCCGVVVLLPAGRPRRCGHTQQCPWRPRQGQGSAWGSPQPRISSNLCCLCS